MREIKFRAWAIASGKMFFPNSDEGWDLDNGSLRPLPNTILMQFTGLSDKDGKEDYVGNIWEVEYCGQKHRFLREVITTWQGYEFAFKCLTGEISPVHANVDEDGIIIGNKFENPELLKAKE